MLSRLSAAASNKPVVAVGIERAVRQTVDQVAGAVRTDQSRLAVLRRRPRFAETWPG